MAGFRNFALGTLFAVSVAASVTPVQALPLPQAGVAPSSDVRAVTHAHGHISHPFSGYRPYYAPGPYYGHRPYYRPYLRPDIGVYTAPRVIQRVPYPRPGVDAHTIWCQSRYRSYDPVTDLFLAYSGDYRACVSPYR